MKTIHVFGNVPARRALAEFAGFATKRAVTPKSIALLVVTVRKGGWADVVVQSNGRRNELTLRTPEARERTRRWCRAHRANAAKCLPLGGTFGPVRFGPTV